MGPACSRLGALRWPVEPTRFYAGVDVVLMLCAGWLPPEPPQLPVGWDVTIGARTSEALEWLDEIIGPADATEWAAFSRWDRAR